MSGQVSLSDTLDAITQKLDDISSILVGTSLGDIFSDEVDFTDYNFFWYGQFFAHVLIEFQRWLLDITICDIKKVLLN